MILLDNSEQWLFHGEGARGGEMQEGPADNHNWTLNSAIEILYLNCTKCSKWKSGIQHYLKKKFKYINLSQKSIGNIKIGYKILNKFFLLL